MEQTIESTLIRILAVVPALFACACTDPGPFANISPRVEVVIDDQTLRAAASLYTGSEPYVLGPDEHLTIGIRNLAVELIYDTQNERLFGRPYYGVGDITDLTAKDEQLTVTVARGTDQGTFTATAPVPFALEAPAAISIGADLVIQWSPPASDSMKWYMRQRGGLGTSDGAVAKDDGTLTVSRAVLATVCQSNCTLDMSVQRTRSTDAGEQFGPGSIEVRRVERAAITVAP